MNNCIKIFVSKMCTSSITEISTVYVLHLNMHMQRMRVGVIESHVMNMDIVVIKMYFLHHECRSVRF